MANLNSQGKDLVTINYKETTIALKSGDKVTLSVTDKKFTEDVVITSVLPEETIVWDGSYTIIEPTATISFTIDGKEFQAIEGMTWGEWVASEYNTRPFYNSWLGISTGDGYGDIVTGVTPNDTIINGHSYLMHASNEPA